MVKMQKRILGNILKTLLKDNTGIPPLRLINQLITDAKEKADKLNNRFYSIFTDEGYIPKCNDNKVNSNLPLVTFSAIGIEHQLL